MVTDGQVSELRRWLAKGKSLAAAADRGFDGQENGTGVSR